MWCFYDCSNRFRCRGVRAWDLRANCGDGFERGYVGAAVRAARPRCPIIRGGFLLVGGVTIGCQSFSMSRSAGAPNGRPYNSRARGFACVGFAGGLRGWFYARGCRGGRSGRPPSASNYSRKVFVGGVTIGSQSFLLSRSAGAPNGRPYISRVRVCGVGICVRGICVRGFCGDGFERGDVGAAVRAARPRPPIIRGRFFCRRVGLRLVANRFRCRGVRAWECGRGIACADFAGMGLRADCGMILCEGMSGRPPSASNYSRKVFCRRGGTIGSQSFSLSRSAGAPNGRPYISRVRVLRDGFACVGFAGAGFVGVGSGNLLRVRGNGFCGGFLTYFNVVDVWREWV